MASAQPQGLPVLYNDIVPLSSNMHGDWRLRPATGATFLEGMHAVPLLADEIISAQRFYPIVFAAGDNPVPLALMGLNEGVNVFIDENGMFPNNTYVPAYIRRYPFMLARLRENSEDLSLCFDPTAGLVGPGDEGEALFDGDEPSERTKSILGFCETFEQSSLGTGNFMRELAEQKLLIEGEFTIQPDGAPQPYVYRGFQIVAEDALRKLRGDIARKWIQNGILGLVYGHLFSLGRLSEIFTMQTAQGKTPPLIPTLNT